MKNIELKQENIGGFTQLNFTLNHLLKMDISDISKVASRKRMNTDAEKLREKVSRETAKIIKLKVSSLILHELFSTYKDIYVY